MTIPIQKAQRHLMSISLNETAWILQVHSRCLTRASRSTVPAPPGADAADGPSRVDHIDQSLRWDPTPLGARVALALSRVLAPLDPARSIELRNHAQDLAVAVGEKEGDPEQVPVILADDEWLVQGFKYGCEQAARWAAHFEAHPPTVWHGDWMMDLDGTHGTRASVSKSSDGFLPGLEVSRLGGDCEPTYGDPVPTLEKAVEIAETRESKWHQDNSDVE